MLDNKEVKFMRSYNLAAHQIIPEYDRLLDFANEASQKAIQLEKKLTELLEKNKE